MAVPGFLASELARSGGTPGNIREDYESLAADGVNQLCLRARMNLATKVRDVDINRVVH